MSFKLDLCNPTEEDIERLAKIYNVWVAEFLEEPNNFVPFDEIPSCTDERRDISVQAANYISKVAKKLYGE